MLSFREKPRRFTIPPAQILPSPTVFCFPAKYSMCNVMANPPGKSPASRVPNLKEALRSLLLQCDESLRTVNPWEMPPGAGVTDQPAATVAPMDVTVALDSLTLEQTRRVNNEVYDPDDDSIEAVTIGGTACAIAVNFEDLNLSRELLEGLYLEMKFEKPCKIQAMSLPMILTPPYHNLVAQAQNGTGKTTCFVLGMLSRIDTSLVAPQALCICPTRELAIQNMDVLLKLGKFTGIKSELAIPASSINYIPVRKRSPITAQVVIGTPGTICSLITLKKLSMSFMKILVFDEADHMLAMGGFRDDSRKIMKCIFQGSPNCQVVLFSATFSDVVRGFLDHTIKDIFSKDYNRMFMKKEELSLSSVKQYKVICPDELIKLMVVRDKILELGDKVGQTIVFVQTRTSACMLHQSLSDLGYDVTTMQGTLNPEERDQIIKEFKDGLTSVLIATDLLARGFDQSQVNLVVNYDLPVLFNDTSEPDYETYLHRVGRAGRFGRKGAVFNLLCSDGDKLLMAKIEKYFKCEIAQVADWESDENFQDALRRAGVL